VFTGAGSTVGLVLACTQATQKFGNPSSVNFLILEGAVVMAEDQVFRCQNPACRCEIRVLRESIAGAANPRCTCGAEMKKPYSKPIR
jgi:hypothetical protein